jgi:hypothetical protein
MATVNIEGLDRADVLAALYNASRPLGMGFLSYNPKPMSRDEARSLLEGSTYFDYLNGRVMKVDLRGVTTLESALYDRDNGPGAAERAIAALRASGEPSNEVTKRASQDGVREAAQAARQMLGVESEYRDGVISLGLGADVAPMVESAIERAEKPE